MSFSHSELCDIGAKWLRNGKYHNCKSVMIECGSYDEKPDVIGFRYNIKPYGSVLIEAKTSYADFLTDLREKPFRAEGKGMGKWRYFLCPEGIISPDSLPPYWGLLYVTPTGRVKVIKGVFEKKKTYTEIQEGYKQYAVPVYDIETEHRLLAINLQGRMYDEEAGIDYRELRKKYKKMERLVNEAERNVRILEEELRVLRNREASLLKRLEDCTCGSNSPIPRIRSSA